VLVFGLSGVIFGARAPTGIEVASASVATTLVLISSVLRGGLNPERRLHVSEQGIRVERLFGSKSLAWWNVIAVRAAPDLSEFRVGTKSDAVVVRTSGMKEEDRTAVLMSLRARLGADQAVQEWRPSRINRESAANLIGTLGSVTLIASLYLLPLLRGGVLGVRCSGPSSYLDRRFDLPPGEAGCVVLRVSGAAARAGVRQGDRMVAMNGAPITSGVQFNSRFFDEAPSNFDFTFVRSGVAQPIEIHVTLGPGSDVPNTPDTDPLAWFLRARGNPDRQQSIAQYTRAIQLAPDFDLAYVFRGELELQSGDPSGLSAGLGDLTQALALDSGSAEAHRTLAQYYERQIFVDLAIPRQYVAQAIQLHQCEGGFTGKNVDCEQDYVALASLLRFRADAPGSIEAAQQAILYYPEAAEPLYQLALSYEIAHDKVQAASYAHRYLSSHAADRSGAGSTDMQKLLIRVAH